MGSGSWMTGRRSVTCECWGPGFKLGLEGVTAPSHVLGLPSLPSFARAAKLTSRIIRFYGRSKRSAPPPSKSFLRYISRRGRAGRAVSQGRAGQGRAGQGRAGQGRGLGAARGGRGSGLRGVFILLCWTHVPLGCKPQTVESS